VHLLIGGNDFKEDQIALKNSPQVIIGTPSRIFQMMEKNNIKFASIKITVIDEADEIL